MFFSVGFPLFLLTSTDFCKIMRPYSVDALFEHVNHLSSAQQMRHLDEEHTYIEITLSRENCLLLQ